MEMDELKVQKNYTDIMLAALISIQEYNKD
jgi:hypothetical protein